MSKLLHTIIPIKYYSLLGIIEYKVEHKNR